MKYFVSYAMAGVPKGPVAIDGSLSLEEAQVSQASLSPKARRTFSLVTAMTTKSVAKNSLLAVAAKRNLRWTFAPFRIRPPLLQHSRTLPMRGAGEIRACSWWRGIAVELSVPLPKLLIEQ